MFICHRIWKYESIWKMAVLRERMKQRQTDDRRTGDKDMTGYVVILCLSCMVAGYCYRDIMDEFEK